MTDTDPLESRALNSLYRNHPGIARGDRWQVGSNRRARDQRDMLLAWAATVPDHRLLCHRNLGLVTLAWIREHQPPSDAPLPLQARISLEAINGVRPVWIAEGVFEKYSARTAEGWPVTVEWGEPDADGFYSPVFTEHPEP